MNGAEVTERGVDAGVRQTPGDLVGLLCSLDQLRVPANELRPGDMVVFRHPRDGVFHPASVEVSRVADPHAITPRWWLLHLRTDTEVLGFTCAPDSRTCYRSASAG